MRRLDAVGSAEKHTIAPMPIELAHVCSLSRQGDPRPGLMINCDSGTHAEAAGVGRLTREIPAMISLTGTADRRRPPCVHLRGLRWLRMVLAWQAVLQVYRAVLDRDEWYPASFTECWQDFWKS